DLTVAVQVVVVLLSGSHVGWLARAYGLCIALSAILKVLSVIRFRKLQPEGRAYRAPGNFRVFGREWPLLLWTVAVVVAVPAAALLIARDPGPIVGASLVFGLAAGLSLAPRSRPERIDIAAAGDDVQLLPSEDADLRHVVAQPGNLLVPVRKPHALTHL